MNRTEERKLVYVALLILCGAIAAMAGPVAGIGSFLQVAVVIELVLVLMKPQDGYAGRRG